MRREGSPWQGLGVVFLKELSDHLTSARMRVLELLEEEMVVDMALMGVTRVDQITPSYICKAAPVTSAHEMSAFVHIPGSGQLR